MDEPEYCSVCNQRLKRLKHPVAHEQHFSWNAEIRTCPHNVLTDQHFAEPRHDEWHHGDHGWVKREM